jgi:hypothetical protein
MIKHMSDTQWSGDREVGWRYVQSVSCTWRRGAWISWLSLQTKFDGLSVVWHQNHWDSFSWFGLKTGGDGFSWFGLKTGRGEFPSLGLKTVSYGLVIGASKSLWRFLDLDLKTKQATVYRLRHKTDGRMKTARGMPRDLVACFTLK